MSLKVPKIFLQKTYIKTERKEMKEERKGGMGEGGRKEGEGKGIQKKKKKKRPENLPTEIKLLESTKINPNRKTEEIPKTIRYRAF